MEVFVLSSVTTESAYFVTADSCLGIYINGYSSYVAIYRQGQGLQYVITYTAQSYAVIMKGLESYLADPTTILYSAVYSNVYGFIGVGSF